MPAARTNNYPLGDPLEILPAGRVLIEGSQESQPQDLLLVPSKPPQEVGESRRRMGPARRKKRPAVSCCLMRRRHCGAFCGAALWECCFSRRKRRLLPILLGELHHSGKEWQSEAGGCKAFCLSVFLEVGGLGTSASCHSLPHAANDPYVAFYVTPKSEPSWGWKDRRTRTSAPDEPRASRCAAAPCPASRGLAVPAPAMFTTFPHLRSA